MIFFCSNTFGCFEWSPLSKSVHWDWQLPAALSIIIFKLLTFDGIYVISFPGGFLQLRIFLRALLQKIALHLLNWLRGASLEFSVSPQPFLAQEGRGLLWERPTPSSTWTLRGHPNSLMKPLPFYALLISNHCYGNPQAWFLGSITNPIFEGLKQTHPFNQPPTPVGVVSKFEARPCHQRSRQHWRIPWLKPNVYWFYIDFNHTYMYI